MLKQLRSKYAAKTILWGIAILIIPAFVLWGPGSPSGGPKEKRPPCVGTIDNDKISFDEFMKNLTNMRIQILLNNLDDPKKAEETFKDKNLIANSAWARIMMHREARRNKVKVSNEELVAYIRSLPLFNRGGAFDDRIYQHLLRYNLGVEPRVFEETMRQNLEIQKMEEIVTKEVTVTDEDLLKEYRKANEKYKIAYIMAAASDYAAKTNIDEKAAKDYYDLHKAEFFIPQQPGDANPMAQMFAPFESVKEQLTKYLVSKESYDAAVKKADDDAAKIKESTEKEKLTFEAAAAKAGLKIETSTLFGLSDYFEGIGEASELAEAIGTLAPDQASGVIKVRKGAIIFKVAEVRKIDEEKFNKEKEEFSKTLLEKRKNERLTAWLRSMSPRVRLNVKLEDIEKYY